MAINITRRSMEGVERERFLAFQETPTPLWWWIGASGMALAGSTCLAGMLSFPLRNALRTRDATLVAIIVGLALALLFIMFLMSEWRKEKCRRDGRRLFRGSLASQGVVEVFDVSLGRAWRITGYAPGFHTSPQVAVELLPHLIAQLPAPTDEDMYENEAEAASVHSMPAPIISGTMPRDRVIVEWVSTSDSAEEPVLLSIQWVGRPLEPIGEIDAFMSPCELELVDSAPPSSLRHFSRLVYSAKKGPWADCQA